MEMMPNTLALFSSTQDWIILAVVVIVLFGGKKIPELMRGVGQGVGELQKGLEEGKRAVSKAAEETTKPTEPNS